MSKSSSSSHKKRKSDVNFENSSSIPHKKDRPWYIDEVAGNGKPAESRRKSIIGLGKGLLRKMRSSSALKERNSDTTVPLASASTSAVPVFKQPSLNVKPDSVSDTDEQSAPSDSSSMASSENSALLASFNRNKELVKLVANSTMTLDSTQSCGDGLSLTSGSFSSEDDVFHMGSVSSLCTPSRNFGHGKSHRGSVRSMPPESDLVRGLCNSAIRRTISSVSDSMASPRQLTRVQSIRFKERLMLSASMAELPEEEVAPIANCNEAVDDKTTPVHDAEKSSRRSSLVWSTIRSKSRIFGSKKRSDISTTPLSVQTGEVVLTAVDGTPLGTKNLRRSSASSSSIHKKVSSALRKGLGIRASILAVDECGRTPAGILKRSSTNSKDRHRSSANFPRRCSDVSAVLQRQVRTDHKKKEADEAKMYMEKVSISDEPVLDILYRDEFDAVVVDVTATGLPVSSVAKQILVGDSAVELHKSGMFNPYKNGVLNTPQGCPDIIYIVSEKDDAPDKRVRVGVATGMREAFEAVDLKKVVAYPFCVSHEENMSDYIVQQFLLASYKAFTWSAAAMNGCGKITLAGVNEGNCEQMQRLYEELINTEIKPKIAAYESVLTSPSQTTRVENDKE